MPILIRPGEGKKRRKKRIKGRPIKPAKIVETAYTRMFRQNAMSMSETAMSIYNKITTQEPSISFIRSQLDDAEARFFALNNPTSAATDIVMKADQLQKRRFEAMLSRAIGVDVIQIMKDKGYRKYVDVAIERNVDLIKSVSKDYFSDVRKSVLLHFEGKDQPEGRTLLEQIRHVGQVSKSRAKIIARDQTQKLNSNFNKIRQEDAGIEKYIWRTAQDERVVGTPGGLYEPTRIHGNHYEREGQEYSWSDPPADGNPGEPVLCRCVAEPIIEIDKIVEKSSEI